MSQNIQANNGNSGHAQTDRSRLLLWNNKTQEGLFDEPVGSGAYTLVAGQVMGRIALTGKLKICSVASTDGSQYPIGVVAWPKTMAQGATGVTITIAVTGDVDEDLLTLSGVETLASYHATNTASQTIRDLLQKSGLNLVSGTEFSNYDNDL